MIRNIVELAEIVCGRCYDTAAADAAAIGRRLYKDTECGIGFANTPAGITLAGYAEGDSGECPAHELEYPFTAADFWAAVEEADREGCERFDEIHHEGD